MRTLLITEIFPPRNGGSGRWFWEVYRRLPRAEYVVAAGEDPRAADFDQTHDLRVVRAPLTLPDWGVCSFRGLRNYWRAFRALRRVVKAEGITRVHCGRCVPEGWLALLLKRFHGLPYVCYAHGEEVKRSSPGNPAGVLSSRQLCWMTRKVLWGADFIVPNSRNTEHILRCEWGLPSDRIHLLYPGVDTERFVPDRRREDVRGRLGWGDRPVVLTVGRLQKRKGHDQMIRALRAVRESVPDVLYAVVGDGEERRALQDLVAQEGLGGGVQFLGEVDDATLIQCYQQCDLFVLPNRQIGSDIEGFGMVLLEAQACGKPVVAGASGGTAETMRIPWTGRTVPCEGPEELAAQVAALLADRDRLDQMGRAAREWVVEKFDWASLSRQALHLFGGDCGSQCPRPGAAAVRSEGAHAEAVGQRLPASW
jgi:phosphatidylinositol alpha-1,6-mannosyltransferase